MIYRVHESGSPHTEQEVEAGSVAGALRKYVDEHLHDDQRRCIELTVFDDRGVRYLCVSPRPPTAAELVHGDTGEAPGIDPANITVRFEVPMPRWMLDCIKGRALDADTTPKEWAQRALRDAIAANRKV